MAEEFTLAALRDYMIQHGGRATNHDLVRHFKKFLTDPSMKDETRAKFRDFVNTLAVVKQEGNEKFLVLKKQGTIDRNFYSSSTSLTSVESLEGCATPPRSHPPLSQYKPRDTRDTLYEQNSPLKNIPSSRNPVYLSDDYLALALGPPGSGEPMSKMPERESDAETAPFLPPRKKQVTKVSASQPSNKENEQTEVSTDKSDGLTKTVEEQSHQLSVKERTQKFNRLASQSALLPMGIRGSTMSAFRRENKNNKPMGGDDDDASSFSTMDPRAREWLLACARGEYNTIAKMLKEEPRLAKKKDYITGYTGLHWAAKHGDTDLIKLQAGTYSADVNARSHGGYTALHLAAQQGHSEVFDLLVDAYHADLNLRDYGGKKPHQYFPVKQSTVSSDTFKKISAKRSLHEEKETGFLRIGSINVRVKKTTEKFNNLLGNSNHLSGDKKHKSWGSADNIQSSLDRQLMPPPKGIKKKRSKEWPAAEKPVIEVINSTVSLAPIHSESEETDSDSAYGFGSDWHA